MRSPVFGLTNGVIPGRSRTAEPTLTAERWFLSVYYPKAYLHYAATMQQRAIALMARKMAAMMALDGRLSVEGLAGMADDESAAMALARSISNNIETADIQRNWVKVASNRKPASSALLSIGQALLEDEPIDGLDLLSIEPHLIAQTLMDNQDYAGEIAISRDVLARMLADFDSIGDEAHDVACTG
jgi:hypothetical protein